MNYIVNIKTESIAGHAIPHLGHMDYTNAYTVTFMVPMKM